ncbi:MAG TPA: CHAT domain-containing protein [Thermoanaerobaculia bacterium]|nr:CHAT domain-containing protein [Thermoanaerobaculia bacterium]
MTNDAEWIDRLIAYWEGDPILDREMRRCCRDFSAALARSLPEDELRKIQDNPELHRNDLSRALRGLILAGPSRDVRPRPQGAAPSSAPRWAPPVRPEPPAPEPGSSTVQNISGGDVGMAFNAGSIAGGVQIQSPAPKKKAEEKPRPASSLYGGLPDKIRILFLGANPQDSTRLRLDAEVREIDRALASAELGGRFELHQKWAVRPSELQMHLLRHRPHLLHFSGHGSRENAIFLEGEDGRSRPIEGIRLARLLAQFNRHLRCVVLNACYSEEQAQAISEHVDCVVGMSTAVLDQAAIRFAATFYQSLAFGSSVQAAFEMCCADIELGELGQDAVPQLLAERQDPAGIVFAEPG